MRRVGLAALVVAAVSFAATGTASAAVPAKGNVRVLAELSTQGSQPATQQAMQDEFARIAAWFATSSFGQLQLTFDVTPWLPVGDFGACPGDATGSLRRAAADAATRAAGIDPSSYAAVVYVYPLRQGCAYAGWGTPAGWSEVMGGAGSDNLIEHEFGHVIGLAHSHSTTCGVWRPTCPVEEYGDLYDTMGNGYGHFSGFQKLALGWIKGTEAGRGGTYSVEQVEVQSAAPQVLAIPTADGSYYVDHRERSLEPPEFAVGPFRPDPSNGVLVYHEARPGGGPVLLAPSGVYGALNVGATLTVAGVFSLRAVAHVGTHVDVAFEWLDAVPPSAPVLREPVDGAAVKAGENPVFAWAGSSDADSGLAGYELDVDGERTQLSADKTITTLHAPAVGTHTWTVTALDHAGNRSASPPRTFVLGKQRQAPEIEVGGKACGSSSRTPCRARAKGFRFVVRAPAAPRSGVAVRLDRHGAAWRTVLRRTRTTNAGGVVAFSGLGKLEPGLWRIVATVPESDTALAATKTAFVRLG